MFFLHGWALWRGISTSYLSSSSYVGNTGVISIHRFQQTTGPVFWYRPAPGSSAGGWELSELGWSLRPSEVIPYSVHYSVGNNRPNGLLKLEAYVVWDTINIQPERTQGVRIRIEQAAHLLLAGSLGPLWSLLLFCYIAGQVLLMSASALRLLGVHIGLGDS